MDFESDIIRFLQSNATNGWTTFFQIVTLFGSFLGLFVSFFIIFSKNKKLAVVLVFTFAVASVLNHVLKALIGRARPFDTYNDIVNLGNEDGFSMPSGHSLCVGIYVGFLIYFLCQNIKDLPSRILGSVALGLIGVLVAFSRMVLGAHYLTDVVAGFFLGIMFAIVGIIVYNVVIKIKTKKMHNERI